jgi:beta-galactosidase GanA
MDYCFGEHTLGAFRQWLQKQYHSLDKLNREWDTEFNSWEEVIPMTTYEIKERECKTLAVGQLENYAPWADHRAFMDISFAQALNRLRDFIREVDPNVPVGIEGTQMPSTWGGYDLWQMSKGIDWVEAYDIANSREIFRSFLPSHAPILSTVFGADLPSIQQKLWWLLLHGDKGCVIWDDEESRCIEKTKEGLPITERGTGLEPIFSELKEIAPLMLQLQHVDDRIAIHYSQASIRAHWMFDTREHGDTWPHRLSSYEERYSRFARVRDSFVRVIEDLGLQYNFVSYEQIEDGELLKGDYKVLLLPQSVAMSKKECEQIEQFVGSGGYVIADNMTATMDEHCKRLSVGQLDGLFGIHRSDVDWKPKAEVGELPTTFSGSEPLQVYEPEIAVTSGKARYTSKSAPAVIENRVGKGNTVYLNLDMHDYGKYRLTPQKGREYQELFRQLLQEADIEPHVKVLSATDAQPVACVEIWRCHGQDADYIALMRNPEFDASSLSDIGYPDNTELENDEGIKIIFPHPKYVADVRTGKEFGVTNQINVELEPWSPIILKLQ